MDKGAGLCYSEMVSAKAVCYNDKKTHKLLEYEKKEHPIFFQIFGSGTDTIANAIKKTQSYMPDGFDINMGCPTPKIVNNGDGCALMKNVELASDIVKAAVDATDLPISVKIRSGWDKDSINAVEFAIKMEQSGASALCIHARTREQYYSPGVNLDIIKQVKQNLKIPVIGNGDIFCAKDAKMMLDYTNCDGIMIGRGAQGNPWIFNEISSFLDNAEIPDPISLDEKMDTVLIQANMMIKQKGEYLAIREIRKHLIWYLKGVRDASKFKNMASHVSTVNELIDITNKIKNSLK